MTRVPQPAGQRGSLKWIQQAINRHANILEDPIAKALQEGGRIVWKSPLEGDEFAEYRDGAFLEAIGQGKLAVPLSAFWPQRGPQWDALGTTTSGKVLLVEAKAHIGEICSPASAASGESRAIIERSLAATALHMGARNLKAPWIEAFYQLANRFAHLHFLRANGVEAWLILVNFVGDEEMNGPRSAAEWEAAYKVVYHVMGISSQNSLSRFIVHLCPSVSQLRRPIGCQPSLA